MLRCLGYLYFLLFSYFMFWDGIKNFIPNMWQIVLANIFLKGRLFTLIYIASFMVLDILYPSLLMILKFSTDVQ